MQSGDMRRFMGAAVDKLSPTKAKELAKGLLEGGASREQLQKVQHDLVEWSSRNREKLLKLIQQEVKRQLKNAGFATRQEVESLRRRVRELEKVSGTGTAKRTSAKASAAKRSNTKSSSRSGAKPTAKRSSAKDSSAGSGSAG
ncbi:MAG: hypothetical protein WEA54_05330 [Actinomycetota bacterium]